LTVCVLIVLVISSQSAALPAESTIPELLAASISLMMIGELASIRLGSSHSMPKRSERPRRGGGFPRRWLKRFR
jgi:hypothetical protein